MGYWVNRRAALKTIGYCVALAGAPVASRYAWGAFPIKEISGELSFYDVRNSEAIDKVRYIDGEGQCDPVAMEELNYFFRCRYDGKVHSIDPKLFRLLDFIKSRMGLANARYHLFSGYRSPEFNRKLKKRGIPVATNSYHVRGMAADISLEGAGLRRLKREAASLRFGGVSRYRHFVHVDVGPFRTW